MPLIYLIFGYGLPRDIKRDENYNFYLKMIFNKVFDEGADKNALLLFSGGPTDCFRPYKRTEAAEMKKFFQELLLNSRPFIKKQTRRWRLLTETRSLSTLENLLNCQKLLASRGLKNAAANIFCEHTRAPRIQKLARKIFKQTTIISIDFDVSANRYLPKDYLRKKESAALRYEALALQSPANLKKHHLLFQEKISRLRRAGSAHQVAAVKAWWDEKLRDPHNGWCKNLA